MHTLPCAVCACPAPGSVDVGDTEMGLGDGEQALVLKELTAWRERQISKYITTQCKVREHRRCTTGRNSTDKS